MISNSALRKIIDIKNHLPKLDDRGALLIPTSLKLKDLEFMKYRHMPVNWHIDAVTEDDLPEEFSPKAVKLVDLFRRKTIDLDYEAMLIFDYKTGELIYCFVNDCRSGEVTGEVDESRFEGKHVSIIHNHPKNFYSPPSSRNFQILSLGFQDYELVSSWDALWILESKEELSNEKIIEIKEAIQVLYENATEKAYHEFLDDEIGFKKASDMYGELLLNYINNANLSVKLIRRDFDDN